MAMASKANLYKIHPHQFIIVFGQTQRSSVEKIVPKSPPRKFYNFCIKELGSQ